MLLAKIQDLLRIRFVTSFCMYHNMIVPKSKQQNHTHNKKTYFCTKQSQKGYLTQVCDCFHDLPSGALPVRGLLPGVPHRTYSQKTIN